MVESEGANFVVKLATSRGDEPLARATEFACEECGGAELLDKLAEEARPVLEKLLNEERPAVPSPTVTPSLEQRPSPADSQLSRREIGPMGGGGLGLLASSVPIAVTGIVFLALGERRVERDPTMLRNFTPPGIALAVTGAVAIVTGAVLVALDRRRGRRATNHRLGRVW